MSMTDQPPQTLRERVAARPWPPVLIGLAAIFLAGGVLGPEGWREGLMALGWLFLAVAQADAGRRAPIGSPERRSTMTLATGMAALGLGLGVNELAGRAGLAWLHPVALALLIIAVAC